MGGRERRRVAQTASAPCATPRGGAEPARSAGPTCDGPMGRRRCRRRGIKRRQQALSARQRHRWPRHLPPQAAKGGSRGGAYGDRA